MQPRDPRGSEGSPTKKRDMGDKQVHFNLVNVNEESPTPVITKPPPTSIPGKKVFLEEYANSNSPEWTRFENPIVFMEDEVLPEELEENVGTSSPEIRFEDPVFWVEDEELQEAHFEQRSTEAPVEDVSEEVLAHRKPESALNAPRRHPLSQVTNMADLTSPVQSQLRGGAEQAYGSHAAPITFLSDSEDGNEDGEEGLDNAVANGGTGAAAITISDDENDEEELDHDGEEQLLHHTNEVELPGFSSDEDDDGEGPDDTFEFKFKSSR